MSKKANPSKSPSTLPEARGPDFKLGILGGGQLAQMLALAAHPYGIKPLIYANSAEEPAAQVTPSVHLGRLTDEKSLETFLRSCDVATFESEFLDANLLQKLSEKTKTPILPSPLLMGKLQDRWHQKNLLLQYKIPTAPFHKISSLEDLQKASPLGSEIVLKQRKFGYDGYGTFFISLKDADQHWEDVRQKTKEDFIGEQKIKFRRELALLLVRNSNGQIIEFPLVESQQTRAQCDWVMGPVSHPKEKALRRRLKTFIEKENYVGVMAFELFDTGKDLLVNEIAPRVHNTGHYSQNAMTLSQFQAHVLAVCNYDLPTPKILSPFAMANLLGQSGETPRWPRGILPAKEACQWHWYGKKENRRFRKMGHINALGKTPQKALKEALKARGKVQL